MHEIATPTPQTTASEAKRVAGPSARVTRTSGVAAGAGAGAGGGGSPGSIAGGGRSDAPDALGALLAAAVSGRRGYLAPPPRSPVPGVLARIVDQHADTHLPTKDELAQIDLQINPTAAPKGGVAQKWDGEVGQPGWKANRAALKAEVSVALAAHLKGVMKRIKERQAGPKLPMKAFEGPGEAAKLVVDSELDAYATAAVLTAPQEHVRDTFQFQAGVQLRDRTKPADFTPDARDVANWMAQTDTKAATAQGAHHFNKDRSDDERAWLDKEVLRPFVTAHKGDLELYDIYGFASAAPGEVLIAPTLAPSTTFPDEVPVRATPLTRADGSAEPTPAERLRRWSMWQTLVHEYIHTLEHPAFKAARKRNRIFSEGFCEMFTEDVLRVWIPQAKRGVQFLRRLVEGCDAGSALWPDFTPDYIHDYSAGQYADYAARAKSVRATLGMGGSNAVRAAFLQGHIELIGLGPDGKIAAPPSTSPPSGLRVHMVVAARDLLGSAVETAAQIATQNGITVAELQDANKGTDLTKLTEGQALMIPVRP